MFNFNAVANQILFMAVENQVQIQYQFKLKAFATVFNQVQF